MYFNAYRHGFPAEFEPGKVSGRCRANGNANVPVGFARHVSRAEEDLSVPKKALQSEGISLTTHRTDFHE